MSDLLPIGQHEYSIGRLNALDQLHVSRKIAPIIPTLMPIITEVAKGDFAKVIESIEADDSNSVEQNESKDLSGLQPFAEALEPFVEAFAKMPEDDVNYIVHKCLSVVKRGGAIVCRNNSIMFDDLDMGQILPLVIAVIRLSLSNFIQGLLMKASNIQQSG
ncbi:phage tail assembly chaperone [Acinetobacter radioresistens]|uniref:phage tail assembly chaperone n=1 Tax=Acinetobacter radioresistens TaxID=40216 RepID=UPI0032120446